MTLQPISAATCPPVSLSEARDFLKISHTEEDALLAAYLRAAADACEVFTGRKLISQQWRLTLNDWDGARLPLRLSPVISVDQVEVWTDSQYVALAADRYLLDRASYQAFLIPAPGQVWPAPTRDVDGVRITLTAGFGAGPNDVPHDIRLGLLHWVAAAYDDDASGSGPLLYLAERFWRPYRRVAL